MQTRAIRTRSWLSTSPGAGNLTLTETEIGAPDAHHMLVRVETAALNFSDLLMIDDRYQIKPPRPFVPGQEIAGTVVEAGAQSGFKAGERIASKIQWGGFAGHALVRGDMAIRIPEGLSSAQASALPVVYTTSVVALTECTIVKPGETVLVLAASGGVGLAAVEVAHHLGARVIAAAGGEDKCALAREHGADETIDYRAPGWSDTVKALTGGKGVDIILDPVGGAACKEALRVLGWQGRLLIVGFASGDIPQIPANRLLLKRASAIGVYWNHDIDRDMLARVSEKLTAMAREGAIRPHIGGAFAFEDLPKALDALGQRRTSGKVVLTLDNKDRA
jgi:NADPH2:quinone reductase